MGYGFAGMRRSSVPHTARRHTQVPLYIPGRTADMVRRAGPMCPVAALHHRFPTGPRPKWRGFLSFFFLSVIAFLFLFIYYY